jgi:hypothetical protein
MGGRGEEMLPRFTSGQFQGHHIHNPDWGCSSLLECLPRMCEGLSLNPGIEKNAEKS